LFPHHTFHDALRGFRAFHQDEEIIGIAGKYMPEPSEFLVEWIEHDVG
jgi:hypothetical protein